jgi:hypothetical protein
VAAASGVDVVVGEAAHRPQLSPPSKLHTVFKCRT